MRRHLIAVRWQDWRLYKKVAEDDWQLFDLQADPREESDLADQHPEVVRQLSEQHAQWSKTLTPIGTIPEISRGEPIIPNGHGWAKANKTR